ncbi:MAG: DEDD exonuclease domain-containing protein [Candidatus Nanopelagicales bacterium]|nr:DEDD exonuclease domain-containing protein [Candidatus Nanopelagicales bacterium]
MSVYEQLATEDLGHPLLETTFVIVDLETTGGSPKAAAITEIGAVKVRGGEVLGEFATLVNPQVAIPPFIAALTGITDSLVASSPTIRAVMPSLLEFIGDAVVVAHNAPFDIGFLTAACVQQDLAWPKPQVVDTARLARVALQRDEVPNCKLGTLAAHFHSPTTPTHRALDDARATVDVLHGLIERIANLGVNTLEELKAFTSRVTVKQREKHYLAKGLPSKPGVYVFRDAQGSPLYVGTSKNIQARVRNYFTAGETRRRINEMVGIATQVQPIVCASVLEARVRELRLISSEQPRYNVRSKKPVSQAWITLTSEAVPRFTIVRTPKDDNTLAFGPFSGRHAAQNALETLNWVFNIRTCTTKFRKIAVVNTSAARGCGRFDLGRCVAPCQGTYEPHESEVARASRAMAGDLREITESITAHLQFLSTQERFEDAAMWRDRLTMLAQSSVRLHRLGQLCQIEELVAACPTASGGWEIHVIRYGRLAGAAIADPGIDPLPIVDSLIATSDAGMHEVLTEETAAIADWIDQPGVRLVRTSAALSMPVHCGGHLMNQLISARKAAHTAVLQVDSGLPSLRPIGPAMDAVTRIRTIA